MRNLDKSTWTRHRFDAIAVNVKDRVDDPASSGYDRYVGLEHLDPRSMTVTRWGDPSEVGATKLVFQPGDVIFGRRRAYQRKVSQATFEGIASAHALVLRAKVDAITERFLPVFLSSDYFLNRAISISVGSLSPTVNWRDLAAQEFDLPPLDEQKRIANLLWAAEEHRGQVNRAFEALQDQSAHWLREKISGEPVEPLERLIAEPVRNGVSKRVNGEGLGYPTLSIAAVRDGRIKPEGNIKHADTSYESIERFVIHSGDFFIVRGNANKNLVARGARATDKDGLPEHTFYPDLLIRVRFNAAVMRPAFGALVWNNDAVHARLVSRAKSTTGTWKVNGKDVRQHELPAPPLPKQDALLRKQAVFDVAAEALRHELKTLNQTRESLLAETFEETR